MTHNDQLITALIKDIAHQLMPRYRDNALCEQYAWWMVEAVTDQKKSELLSHTTIELSEEQDQQLTHWIAQQVDTGIPLQYLLGSVPFMDLTLLVEPPTLIPRMETEEWVTYLIETIRASGEKKLALLDLCTGSGCIALALATAFPDARVYATDIAPTALALARKNVDHNEHRADLSNVTILKSDLYAALPEGLMFDLITSNPPYIAEQAWRTLDESVKEWEDKKALVADDEGLALIKKIITQAPAHLRPARPDMPSLVIEIGHDQGAAVAQLMEDAGFIDVCIEHDMAGKDRIVTGRWI